jgi:hypothetical protein
MVYKLPIRPFFRLRIGQPPWPEENATVWLETTCDPIPALRC